MDKSLERIIRIEIANDNIPVDCPIKGNINRDGERIYHVPGQVVIFYAPVERSPLRPNVCCGSRLCENDFLETGTKY